MTTIVESLTFVDEIPGRGSGRAPKYDAIISQFLPLLQENAGKPAILLTETSNSVVTQLKKTYGELGLTFTFRADDGTDGKSGKVYVVYTAPVETPAEDAPEAPAPKSKKG